VIVLGLKKIIGKMGTLAKQGASRASEAVKAKYHQAKEHYPENKRRIKKAVAKADKWAGKSLDYATRVRDNTEKSIFLNSKAVHRRHEASEQFLIGSNYERAEHHKPRRRGNVQTIVININNDRRKKKRKSQNKRSGFSLI
jgi:hypothetical protein